MEPPGHRATMLSAKSLQGQSGREHDTGDNICFDGFLFKQLTKLSHLETKLRQKINSWSKPYVAFSIGDLSDKFPVNFGSVVD